MDEPNANFERLRKLLETSDEDLTNAAATTDHLDSKSAEDDYSVVKNRKDILKKFHTCGAWMLIGLAFAATAGVVVLLAVYILNVIEDPKKVETIIENIISALLIASLTLVVERFFRKM